MRQISVGRLRLVAAACTLIMIGLTAACTPSPVAKDSSCRVNGIALVCPYRTTTMVAAGETRTVLWQVPRGTAPAGGWPVVIHFQGSVASPILSWTASPLEPFGAYTQTQVIQRLLDKGFAVLTPATHLAGVTFWDTNNPLVANYTDSNDHAFMKAIFAGIDAGTFGDTNPDRLYATGISSGGYMTSRMAISYPGKFRALAIQSASYATCLGPICDVGPIPEDHPPTLFLHGGIDPIVPLFTMDMYNNKLRAAGIETRRIVDPLALHRWIDESPSAVVNWFLSHP
ncbi:MAG TPA: hypothetical protein VL068_01020 [Microthrixaceae bacterium]|nr:hypothetical protein [Microthrixaceae bacterium]